MQLSTTYVKRDNGVISVEFVGSDGDLVSVRLAEGLEDIDDQEATKRASAVMVQLTAFGTRVGADAQSQFTALETGQAEAHAGAANDPDITDAEAESSAVLDKTTIPADKGGL